MASINHVLETQWAQKNVSQNTWSKYSVTYDSGRRVTYDNRKTLPMSLVSFILSDNVEAETNYFNNDVGPLGIVKYTKYTRR